MFYKISAKLVFIIGFYMLGFFNAQAQCTQPSAKSSTSSPSSYDYVTTSNGDWNSSSTWVSGYVPSIQPSNKKIKIRHSVYVSNGNIQLKSGSILKIDKGELIIKNGNLELLDGNAEKFLAEYSEIKVSGNIQQTSNTVFYAKNIDLQVGDKGDASGYPLFASGSSTTSADFQNDGGYRRLENVCMTVTHNYDNKGEDELINVCADIGLRYPLNGSNPLGQGSGSISNYSGSVSMKIYESQFFVPNGNVINSDSIVTCDTKFKLTNGNFQNQSSSLWTGDSLCIWVTGSTNHSLQNSGTWRVAVRGLCINGQIQGNYSTSLPSQDCSAISGCFVADCCSDIAVPVTWLKVSASKNENGTVNVNWSTGTEINNSHFEVDRSGDGQNWTKIGQLKGNGNSNRVIEYSFTDEQPMVLNYYRLKQVDFDGKFEYTDIKIVDFQAGKITIHGYPNPTEGKLTLDINRTSTSDVVQVDIMDIQGNSIQTMNFDPNGTQNLITTVDISNCKGGLYIVRVISGQTIQNFKLTKF